MRARHLLRRPLVAALLGLAVAAAAPLARADRAADRLGDELRRLLGTYRWRDAHWGVLVVSLDRGDTLFAADADSLMAPASNMKVLTSVAALATLGPEHRFRTYLLGDGPVRDGVLEGDLILYGTGDPGLSDRFLDDRTDAFHALADGLEAAGVHTVRGALVADASFLPAPLRPEGWDPRDLDDAFAAPVSALSFNQNAVSLQVEAAPLAGLPPVVHTIPDRADLDLVNEVVTVDRPPGHDVWIFRDEPGGAIRVIGEIRRGGPDVWRRMSVSDPARFTASVFRSVLEERGVRLAGPTRVVTDPSASVLGGRPVTAPRRAGGARPRILGRHVSPPLIDYVTEINKQSDNLVAELTFRTLGRMREGVGSPEASARAVAEALRALGVDTRAVVQLDGSGLSAGNRVTAGTLVDVLRRAERSAVWEDLLATLPEAGRPRELARMYRTAAARNLRAKTGTIERVSALTGIVRSADGERLAFSILVNGTPSTSAAKRIENLIGARLATFRREVDRAADDERSPAPSGATRPGSAPDASLPAPR